MRAHSSPVARRPVHKRRKGLARFLRYPLQHSTWQARKRRDRTEQGPVLRTTRMLEGRMSGDIRPSLFSGIRLPARCCWGAGKSAGDCRVDGTGGIRRSPQVAGWGKLTRFDRRCDAFGQVRADKRSLCDRRLIQSSEDEDDFTLRTARPIREPPPSSLRIRGGGGATGRCTACRCGIGNAPGICWRRTRGRWSSPSGATRSPRGYTPPMLRQGGLRSPRSASWSPSWSPS